jgi:hypothetical protein
MSGPVLGLALYLIRAIYNSKWYRCNGRAGQDHRVCAGQPSTVGSATGVTATRRWGRCMREAEEIMMKDIIYFNSCMHTRKRSFVNQPQRLISRHFVVAGAVVDGFADRSCQTTAIYQLHRQMSSLASTLGLCCIATALFLRAVHAGVDWNWQHGRATHYGGPNDPWSIHSGVGSLSGGARMRTALDQTVALLQLWHSRAMGGLTPSTSARGPHQLCHGILPDVSEACCA